MSRHRSLNRSVGRYAVSTSFFTTHGTFTRKIRHYALTAGALSVESAIRAQTSLPARIMGLADRGEIRGRCWCRGGVGGRGLEGGVRRPDYPPRPSPASAGQEGRGLKRSS